MKNLKVLCGTGAIIGWFYQNVGFRGWNGSFKAILRAFWVLLGHFGPGHHLVKNTRLKSGIFGNFRDFFSKPLLINRPTVKRDQG